MFDTFTYSFLVGNNTLIFIYGYCVDFHEEL